MAKRFAIGVLLALLTAAASLGLSRDETPAEFAYQHILELFEAFPGDLVLGRSNVGLTSDNALLEVYVAISASIVGFKQTGPLEALAVAAAGSPLSDQLTNLDQRFSTTSSRACSAASSIGLPRVTPYFPYSSSRLFA